MINAMVFWYPTHFYCFLLTHVKLCFQGLESALSDNRTTAAGVCDSSARDVNPDCHIGSHSSGVHPQPPLRRGSSESSTTSDKSSTTSASSESSWDESSDPSEESHETLPEPTDANTCSEEANRNRSRFLRDKHQLDKKVSLGDTTGRTVIEILVLSLSYAMRHGLNDVAIEDLLTLINDIAGVQVIPQSLYLFRSIFRFDCGIDYHFYCSVCQVYLGCYSNLEGKKSMSCWLVWQSVQCVKNE